MCVSRWPLIPPDGINFNLLNDFLHFAPIINEIGGSFMFIFWNTFLHLKRQKKKVKWHKWHLSGNYGSYHCGEVTGQQHDHLITLCSVLISRVFFYLTTLFLYHSSLFCFFLNYLISYWLKFFFHSCLSPPPPFSPFLLSLAFSYTLISCTRFFCLLCVVSLYSLLFSAFWSVNNQRYTGGHTDITCTFPFVCFWYFLCICSFFLF